MDQEYDVIVLGTGLKECILSGLMSTHKKKVLHMDRNSYYGGESASLNLEQLYQKFRPGQAVPTDMGRTRDYCVDLCPKFLMACGNLVKVLLHTKVTRYLAFKCIAGSYVFADKKVEKVPATASEALSSSLMGIFQKRKFKNFLEYCNNYDQNIPKTWQGYDCTKKTAKELYDWWKLDESTCQFTGHAIALHLSDDYLNVPAADTINRIKLYAYSVSRYGNSPYIYPEYGLGGLPEGFSRLCAINGGTYMLNKPVAEIIYGTDGKVVGVKDTEGAIAKCNQLICDPSYVLGTDKIRKTGQIVRCIALLSHPIPNTKDADSVQIIIPAAQLKRKSDIYISLVSYVHKVVPNNKYVAVISTNLEGKDQDAELKPAMDLLGTVDQAFTWVSDHYVPTSNGEKDNVFVTSSYDSTSHFESATDEVIELFTKIYGTPLDLTITADPEDLEQQQ